jgi:DNA gyrase subunit A
VTEGVETETEQGVRLFTGRNSVGVRGIKLAKGDDVISLSVLGLVDATTEERDVYMRIASARRRAEAGENGDGDDVALPEGVEMADAQFDELTASEEFILSVTENGFGKRTSERNGQVVATFPIAASDQIMLVTDRGQLIRSPVHDVRIASRRTQGVTLFKVSKEERVVSVAWLPDMGDEDDEEDEAGAVEGEDAVDTATEQTSDGESDG